MESKEQIDKRSSATESAAAMHEDAINLPADDEDADKPGLQVNSRMLPLASHQLCVTDFGYLSTYGLTA